MTATNEALKALNPPINNVSVKYPVLARPAQARLDHNLEQSHRVVGSPIANHSAWAKIANHLAWAKIANHLAWAKMAIPTNHDLL
jgi:hypothetical protein